MKPGDIDQIYPKGSIDDKINSILIDLQFENNYTSEEVIRDIVKIIDEQQLTVFAEYLFHTGWLKCSLNDSLKRVEEYLERKP